MGFVNTVTVTLGRQDSSTIFHTFGMVLPGNIKSSSVRKWRPTVSSQKGVKPGKYMEDVRLTGTHNHGWQPRK